MIIIEADFKGSKKQATSDNDRKSRKSSSETPLNKLSRKPNKKQTYKPDDSSMGAPIEMSELDSSGNSISLQVAYRSEEKKDETGGAKSIEDKMRKKKESLLYGIV